MSSGARVHDIHGLRIGDDGFWPDIEAPDKLLPALFFSRVAFSGQREVHSVRYRISPVAGDILFGHGLRAEIAPRRGLIVHRYVEDIKLILLYERQQVDGKILWDIMGEDKIEQWLTMGNIDG